MRIIAGIAKGRKLKSIENSEVRPTLDRVKEAIFNILGPLVQDCNILDLFAGFGNLGLEALSRGANKVTFVEKNYKNSSIIKSNLELCNFQDRGKVITEDVFTYLKRETVKFDMIFMDPPYQKNLIENTLKKIVNINLIYNDSIIIGEMYHKITLKIPESLHIIKQKKYGDTRIDFYSRGG